MEKTDGEKDKQLVKDWLEGKVIIDFSTKEEFEKAMKEALKLLRPR